MLNSKILEIEESLKDEFKKIENVCFVNSEKVLNAFHKFNLNTSDFNGTTGYGWSRQEHRFCQSRHCPG